MCETIDVSVFLASQQSSLDRPQRFDDLNMLSQRMNTTRLSFARCAFGIKMLFGRAALSVRSDRSGLRVPSSREVSPCSGN